MASFEARLQVANFKFKVQRRKGSEWVKTKLADMLPHLSLRHARLGDLALVCKGERRVREPCVAVSEKCTDRSMDTPACQTCRFKSSTKFCYGQTFSRVCGMGNHHACVFDRCLAYLETDPPRSDNRACSKSETWAPCMCCMARTGLMCSWHAAETLQQGSSTLAPGSGRISYYYTSSSPDSCR